ncbi:MAG: hypothetical protein EA409_13835 [Saprospirales bacterium]|nr:MAG: hypothetical protein EA409_13835 [Saprospirales bacterium]
MSLRVILPLVALLSGLLFLSSCGPPKAISRIHVNEKKDFERVALIQVMFSQFNQPVLPLLDAAAFNGKINRLAPEIMEMQEEYLDDIRHMVVERMSEFLSGEIVYGEKLQALMREKGFAETHNFNENLLTGNNNFPLVLLASGEFNVFRFEKGNALHYFTRDSRYPRMISHICEKLGVDAIAVSVSYFEVTRVGSFGMNGSLRLNTHLFVMEGDRGSMAINAMTASPPTTIPGNELHDYKIVLDHFPEIIDLLFTELK